MKMRKRPELKDVPVELIKNTGYNGVKYFLCLLNKLWKTQQWPDEWQKSVFIPLPKKGDITKSTNNHLIALISHASKLSPVQHKRKNAGLCEVGDI